MYIKHIKYLAQCQAHNKSSANGPWTGEEVAGTYLAPSILTFWTQESRMLEMSFSFGCFSPGLAPFRDCVKEDILVFFSTAFSLGSRKTVTGLSATTIWCFPFFNTPSLPSVETLNIYIHIEMGAISNNPLTHASVPCPSTLPGRAAPCVLEWWVGDKVRELFQTLK